MEDKITHSSTIRIAPPCPAFLFISCVLDVPQGPEYVLCHVTCTVGVKKKFPFRLHAMIILQCEHLRSVLHNHSLLRLLIQQLLPPGGKQLNLSTFIFG